MQIKQNKPNVNKTKSEIRNQTELPSCSRVQKDEVGGVYLSLGQAKVGANKRTINKQLSTSLSLSLFVSDFVRCGTWTKRFVKSGFALVDYEYFA